MGLEKLSGLLFCEREWKTVPIYQDGVVIVRCIFVGLQMVDLGGHDHICCWVVWNVLRFVGYYTA